MPTSPLPTSQPKIPPHLAPDRPASFSCCVLSLSEWLNTTTADHLPTPKIQNLPGQSLLWVPYTLLRHLYHPLRWIRDQAQALIGDAVAGIVANARDAGKPIVLERLDFRQKKSVLEGESRRYSRMLSSFSYGKVKASFLSRGIRQGVQVHQVNPAFSSVIGRVKFMERYWLSVHQAAALALARRLLGCSERIPRRRVCPVGNGVQVAFSVPARKRVKHVWTCWGAVLGQLRPALAAQHRLGRRRRRPNPVQAVSSMA